MKKKFILLLILLTVVAYSPSLKNGFVVDDENLILHNPIIKSAELFPLIFKTALSEYSDTGRAQALYDRMFRPFQSLTYWLEYKVFSANPFGYHLVNIILHVLNAILVFVLFSLIFDMQIAAFCAMLFAVSPLQASVVSYVSARADLLSSLFMLLSMIYFHKSLQSKTKVFYFFSLICCFAALFCRESALILPIFIALLLYVSKARPVAYLRIIPYTLVCVVYVTIRWIIFGFYGLTMHPPFLNLFLRAVNFLNIAVKYVILILFPIDLRMSRTTPFIKTFFDLRLIYIVLSLLAIIYAFLKFRKDRLKQFGFLFFAIGLIPVFFCFDGYLFYGQSMMAESWVYLSCVGIFVLLALAVKGFFGKYLKFILAVFLTAYVVLSIFNNGNWKDDPAVYQNSLKYLPEQNPLHCTLARKYLEAGKFEQAAYEIRLYAKHFPESSLRYVLQGDFYYAAGDYKKAVDNYRLALRLNNRSSQACSGLSRSYKALGRHDPALEFADESVRLNPYSVKDLVWLGDLYLEKNDLVSGLRYFEMAREVDPSNKVVAERLQRCKTNQ